jgi:hypothetical protein
MPPGIDRKAYWKKPEARYYENQPKRATVYSRNRTNKLTTIEKEILSKMNIDKNWIGSNVLAIQMGIYYNGAPGGSLINNHLKKFYEFGWVDKIGEQRGEVRTKYKINEKGIAVLAENYVNEKISENAPLFI